MLPNCIIVVADADIPQAMFEGAFCRKTIVIPGIVKPVVVMKFSPIAKMTQSCCFQVRIVSHL